MGTIEIDGSTPKLTIGNATAEDALILFDGNAQDFYIALDDSADDLLIGLGSTVGTTPAISIDENLAIKTYGDITMTGTTPVLTIGDAGAEDTAIVFDGNAQDYHVGLDDSADSLVIGLGSSLGTTPAMTVNSSQVVTFAQNPVFPDGGVAVIDLDIDGATDIGEAIVDADLFIIDNGAGGTNRKTAASRLKTYIGGGLSETETWRVSSGANVSAGGAALTANWEQDDTYGAVNVGTGMTESSGVFSFPSTGIWEIDFIIGYINDNGGNQSKYLGAIISVTTNNSSYNTAANNYNSNAPESSSIYSFARTKILFDVTNTSNDKVKFSYSVQQDFAYTGSSSVNETHVHFKRLGDT